ncbi:hypothetical protein DH2020_002795 [Rehmannia glutinosa]|uniref:RING-type E3 ubiquitin transferase n=1 Tax=Rehmannia glutinosa TaxID=99300 RepID=A0ABR0XV15_REHGL
MYLLSKGVCVYGGRCRYEHVKVSRSQSLASSSTDDVRVERLPGAAVCGAGLTPDVTSGHSASTGPLFPSTRPAWRGNSEHGDVLDGDYDLESFNTVDPSDQSICSFAAAGDCPRGEKCPHIHGDLCPICGKQCLHPFKPHEREEHMKTCEKRQKYLEAHTHSRGIECSVCLESVLSKPTAAERKFGILSECDHPFCISCIKNWRSSSPASGLDVNSAHAYRDGRLEEVVLRHLGAEDGNTVIAKDIRSLHHTWNDCDNMGVLVLISRPSSSSGQTEITPLRKPQPRRKPAERNQHRRQATAPGPSRIHLDQIQKKKLT